MNAIKSLENYPVFLRAFEGLAFLALVGACLAVSLIIRREPLF